MSWPHCCKITRLAGLLLFFHSAALRSPVAAFLQPLAAPPASARPLFPVSASSLLSSDADCNQHRLRARPVLTRSSFDSRLTTAQQRISRQGARAGPARGPASRLWMSSPAPPVKPPKKRGWGGGGRGDDLYVRELLEPEKSAILTGWRDYAKADGGEKFKESLQIINDMIAWRSGVVAARKRRFTLACCKGSAVQAVACVQIGPRNESVRSFLAQDACMSLCLLNVDPQTPQFKAGAHLCKEIKEIGRLEEMAVDFQPIKDIYSGRFYAATLTM